MIELIYQIVLICIDNQNKNDSRKNTKINQFQNKNQVKPITNKYLSTSIGQKE